MKSRLLMNLLPPVKRLYLRSQRKRLERFLEDKEREEAANSGS